MGLADASVRVFAAASLKEALDKVAETYPGQVVISYGGSGLVARQVAAGAPADVVVLANVAWMDWLQSKETIVPDKRMDLLGNNLVLIGPSGAPPVTDVVARLGEGRLAIGQTNGVPAGIYGRQWLERTGLWEDLAGHLAETENVRAALALVSRGEAPLGVVYASDALADPGVAVVLEIPGDQHDPIIYPVAPVKEGNALAAAAFIGFMTSEPVAEIFRNHGFIPLRPPS
ncbi:Molybdate-binding periplasmic protein precursor [Roseovarius litorisediminis]|uniref:Molybdate-binding periplasmic protein n=1 Tax=Roseovarius litorisediminis TaxID=1312363 RepID=A0A1Y5SUU9_9RHOB|nr:Molybdate-binding periplasmic protein precursor [Roseovarius litorisediminis]